MYEAFAAAAPLLGVSFILLGIGVAVLAGLSMEQDDRIRKLENPKLRHMDELDSMVSDAIVNGFDRRIKREIDDINSNIKEIDARLSVLENIHRKAQNPDSAKP